MLGGSIDSNYYLDPYIKTQRQDAERLAVYSDNECIEYDRLGTNEKYVHSFPTRYVYKIKDAIIDPLGSVIYDRNGNLIAESTSWLTLRFLQSYSFPLINKPKKTVWKLWLYGCKSRRVLSLAA